MPTVTSSTRNCAAASRGATFRHGRSSVPRGEPATKYYAEWEFPNGRVQGAARTDEFLARARTRWDGDPVPGHFAEVAVTEPAATAGLDPAELGFETIVYEKVLPAPRSG